MEFSIQQICKSFNRNPVLKNLNLTIQSNESIGIIGENGSGKTTLLKIISGLMRPDSGRGLLNNLSIFGSDYNYRKDICYWGHQSDSYPYMTVFENISLFLQLRNDIKSEEQIYSILELVGLTQSKNQLLGEFSAGMIQRFHIARLKLSSWSLAIIDEPTNALDESGLGLLNESINSFKKNEKSLIISSHNIHFIQQHCQSIYKLKNGTLEIVH
ncbi:MAG: ABC transporter ATP-binding protein [Candidatus Marinimicrobia bacterium]|nr:ABC transporter ATP-binding protein [Candidatus Neomarinimicrobiota bacterium]